MLLLGHWEAVIREEGRKSSKINEKEDPKIAGEGEKMDKNAYLLTMKNDNFH